MSHPRNRTISTSCAALAALALVIGGGLAAESTGSNLTHEAKTVAASSSVFGTEALVEVTGTILEIMDLPADEPDLFIQLDSGLAVPIDRQSLSEEVAPDQVVEATVVVPTGVVDKSSPEVAGILAHDGGASGSLDASQGAGAVLVEAAAEAALALDVAELAVVAEAPVALAGTPAPHWVDIAFLSVNGRAKWISESDMTAYIGVLSTWWARETRGEVSSFQFSYADARVGRTSARCVSSGNGAFEEAARLFGHSSTSPYSGASRRHLLIVSPIDENKDGCADYAGVASVGSAGLASGGVTHIPLESVENQGDVLIHEIGHNLGLLHAASATCPEGVVDGPIGSIGQQICSCYEVSETYGDRHNVMGIARWETTGLNGWQKATSGILAPGMPEYQVITASGAYDVTLRDSTWVTGPGIEALKILETRGSSIAEYYVEYDPRIGGVSIRHLNRYDDASLFQYLSGETFVLTPGGSHPSMGQRWRTGQTMESVGGGLTVRVDEVNASQARVHVELTLSNPWVRVSKSQLRIDDVIYPETTTVTTSGGAWTATSDAAWLTPTASGTSGQSLTASVAENPTGGLRSGIITVRSSTASAKILVVQGLPRVPVSVSPTTWASEASATSAPVVVTTRQGAWSASSNQSWLTLSPPTGASGGSLYLNTTTNTGPARSATVTVTASGGTVTIPVTQPAAGTTLTLEFSGWTLYHTGSSLDVRVSTNQPSWSASSDQAWLSVSPTSGLPEGKMKVSVANNPTVYEREGRITVLAAGKAALFRVRQGAKPYISLSQSEWSPGAGAASLEVLARSATGQWNATSNQPWLTVSDRWGLSGDLLTVSAAANVGAARQGVITLSSSDASATLTVTQASGQAPASLSTSVTSWSAWDSAASTTVQVATDQPSWSASSNQSWLTVSPVSGAGGASATLSVQANVSSSSRSGVVTFTAGGASSTVMVSQAAPAGVTSSVSLSVSQWSPRAEASQIPVAVTTNQASWSASSNQSWLSVSPASGADGGTMTVSTSANTSSTSRSGTVTVTAGGASATLSVVQAGGAPATVSVSIPSWSVWTGVASTGVLVTTNQASWTASSNQSWLTVSPSSGASGATLSVSVSANSGAARSGTVTVTAGGASATVSVTQAGESVTASVSLSQTAWAPSSSLASTGVVVTTNQSSWSASSNQSWLTASPVTGASGATMLVSVQANTGAARSGTVTVTAGGASATLAVTQAASVVQPPPSGCGDSYATACAWNLAPIRVSPGPSGTALKFTAPTSGAYVFESSDRAATSNPFGILASTGGIPITSDDDSAGSLNFRLSANLVAGQSYFVAGLNRSGSGAFTITARTPG
ncbi:MAG: hypothetical protein FWD59_00485 [Micrococcales bacterium]|nr:hypothetical protein [Micrococcales bacterium]